MMTGRAGYKRKYLCGMAPNMATRVDDEARVIMRQHPDSVGNVNSPMATIFDLGSFVSALGACDDRRDHECQARIWTQMQKTQEPTASIHRRCFLTASRAAWRHRPTVRTMLKMRRHLQ